MLPTLTEQINITLEKSRPLALLYIITLLKKEFCLEAWNAGSVWLGVVWVNSFSNLF